VVRGLILAAVALVAFSVAHAADLEGISMPDKRVMDGTQMRLTASDFAPSRFWAFAFI
jgi:hypothetical protein